MGLLAFWEQQTTLGTTDRIEIHKDGFSDPPRELISDSKGFTFSHDEITAESSDGYLSPFDNKIQQGKLDFYPKIRGAADEQVLKEIADAADNTVQIIWKIDGVEEWRGFSNSKLLRGREAAQYTGRIRANDFEIMKGIDFSPTARQPWIQTIADIFASAGFALNIQTSTSWIIDGGVDTTDFLSQAEHDTYALQEYGRTGDEANEPITLWEALEHAAEPALLIRQQHGKILVEQLTAFANPAAVSQTTYNPDATVATATAKVDRTQEIFTSKNLGSPHVKNTTETDSYPGIKQARVKFDHRTKVSGIQFPEWVRLMGSDQESFGQLFLSDGDQKIQLSGEIFYLLDANFTGGPFTDPVARYELSVGPYWWDDANRSW
jgi:hypothetical protein